MAILITSPTKGSLQINNSSASPTTQYLCNLKTVTVNGDVFLQAVNILNSEGQPLTSIPLNKLTNVGASGGFSTGTLQNAIDAIASLVITT